MWYSNKANINRAAEIPWIHFEFRQTCDINTAQQWVPPPLPSFQLFFVIFVQKEWTRKVEEVSLEKSAIFLTLSPSFKEKNIYGNPNSISDIFKMTWFCGSSVNLQFCFLWLWKWITNWIVRAGFIKVIAHVLRKIVNVKNSQCQKMSKIFNVKKCQK